jgi:hypothetical protein
MSFTFFHAGKRSRKNSNIQTEKKGTGNGWTTTPFCQTAILATSGYAWWLTTIPSSSVGNFPVSQRHRTQHIEANAVTLPELAQVR